MLPGKAVLSKKFLSKFVIKKYFILIQLQIGFSLNDTLNKGNFIISLFLIVIGVVLVNSFTGKLYN